MAWYPAGRRPAQNRSINWSMTPRTFSSHCGQVRRQRCLGTLPVLRSKWARRPRREGTLLSGSSCSATRREEEGGRGGDERGWRALRAGRPSCGTATTAGGPALGPRFVLRGSSDALGLRSPGSSTDCTLSLPIAQSDQRAPGYCEYGRTIAYTGKAVKAGKSVVPATGFEPVVSTLKGWRPRPLDDAGALEGQVWLPLGMASASPSP